MNAAEQMVPCASLDEARRRHDAGQPFRLRLVFVGANHANASGHSDKFWQVATIDRTNATVRWGRNGSAGQSQVVDPCDCLARALGKLRKGYTVATAAAPAARPVSASLADLVRAASWRPVTLDALAHAAAERGLYRCDLADGLALPGGLAVVTYLSERLDVYGVARDGDILLLALLRAA